MNQPPAPIYPAARIAVASGLSRQAIYAGLAAVEPAGVVMVGGREVSAWRLQDLPVDWQCLVAKRGVTKGFANGEAYIASLPPAWDPPLPWAELSKAHQDKAVRLQKALATALQMRADGRAAAEVEKAAMEGYKSEFGYSMSDRNLRRLLHRTIDRDAGNEEWQRLELYVDERAYTKRLVRRNAVPKARLHRPIDDVIATLENRQSPTLADRQFLWDGVFRHYESLVDTLPDTPKDNRTRKLIKLSLVQYLSDAFPAGTLSASLASLRRRFDEKLGQWRDRGRTPEGLDQRPVRSGNFRKEDFSEDLQKLLILTAILHGNESLAFRTLYEEGKFSDGFRQRYSFNPRVSKSAVPKSIREDVTPEAESAIAFLRGLRQAKQEGPHTPRDWSNVRPGDWFCADDVTWNHYFKEQAPDGRWIVTRGECLLMTDLRTGNPLGFLLIPGRYNGEHVRSLILRVHDDVGLPRRGFYFEKGVWASRLINGDSRQGTPTHWRDSENGLRQQGLNLEVRHATTAKAKPIEGQFHILQDRMRQIPGFVGFNERTERFEREQALIARAHRGDPAALQKFPTMVEWRNKITQVLEDFAHDPQNGKMVHGVTPREAWNLELSQRPLRRLPENARYILSTHRKRVTVRQSGILLTIRGQKRLYFNEHTGPLIGREVLAYYNIEMPDLLTVSDLKAQQFFTVRQVELPAMDATKEQLAEVYQLRKGHMAHARGIFGEVQQEVVSTITRDRDHSEEVKELGAFHNAEVKKAATEKASKTRKLGRIREKAATQNVAITRDIRNPDRVLEGLERMRYYRQRMEAKNDPNPGAPAEEPTLND